MLLRYEAKISYTHDAGKKIKEREKNMASGME
jgi:hypothetical protein